MSSEKFKNKYRIRSSRLQNWDYCRNAAYFTTICTKDRKSFFGKNVQDILELSDIGRYAHKCLIDIPDHFTYVRLVSSVVMPDHVHIILIINNPVEALHATPLQSNISDGYVNRTMKNISPKPGSLSTVIRSYKSAVTRFARKINPDFGWQPCYYDRIVRDDDELERIRKYIDNHVNM